MKMIIPLEACPFCGSRDIHIMEHKPLKLRVGHYWYGNCLPCDCEGPPAADAQEAIENWNRRSVQGKKPE